MEEEEEDSKVFSQRGNGFRRPADRGRVSGVRCARDEGGAYRSDGGGGERRMRRRTRRTEGQDVARCRRRPSSYLFALCSTQRRPLTMLRGGAVFLAWVSREMKFRNLCLSAGGARACLQGNASGLRLTLICIHLQYFTFCCQYCLILL